MCVSFGKIKRTKKCSCLDKYLVAGTHGNCYDEHSFLCDKIYSKEVRYADSECV